MFLLQGVQVVSLVAYDNPNAGEDDAGGFDVVEGGFTEDSRTEDAPF